MLGADGYNRKLDILGSRVAVYWSEDEIYYRGQIVGYNFENGQYRVHYDDGLKEEVQLNKERFRWLLPRGSSAGYCRSVQQLFIELGAEITGPQETCCRALSQVVPTGQECVGYNVGIYWGGNQSYLLAEVVAFNSRSGYHHVLYRDGEGEWLILEDEKIQWYDKHRCASFAAGVLEDGKQPPRGKNAVGWRVGIYCKEFQCFRECSIASYDNSTGKHKVVFVDGSQHQISLSSVRVIWRLPPNITEVSDISVQQRPRSELLKQAGVLQMDSCRGVRLISPSFVGSSSPLIYVYPQEKTLQNGSKSKQISWNDHSNSETTTAVDADVVSRIDFERDLESNLMLQNITSSLGTVETDEVFQQQPKKIKVDPDVVYEPIPKSMQCCLDVGVLFDVPCQGNWSEAKLQLGDCGRVQFKQHELNERCQLCDIWLRRIHLAEEKLGCAGRFPFPRDLVDLQIPQGELFKKQKKDTIVPNIKQKSLAELHIATKKINNEFLKQDNSSELQCKESSIQS
eukprot:TRINITY_DN5695_c0_g1_i2.p1 TRINITY_DN5695_c0_g1~~TRINITY_DN5695_c0_g1_i2.p1  ORF type:complete len:512 (-),score=40.50 TRINITY_DN5695_c0_g1_i2:268-1803(-)